MFIITYGSKHTTTILSCRQNNLSYTLFKLSSITFFLDICVLYLGVTVSITNSIMMNLKINQCDHWTTWAVSIFCLHKMINSVILKEEIDSTSISYGVPL